MLIYSGHRTAQCAFCEIGSYTQSPGIVPSTGTSNVSYIMLVLTSCYTDYHMMSASALDAGWEDFDLTSTVRGQLAPYVLRQEKMQSQAINRAMPQSIRISN